MIYKISPNPENPPLSPFTKGGSSSWTKRRIRKNLGRTLKYHKLTIALSLPILLSGLTASLVFADPVSTNTLTKPISAFNSFKVESSTGMAFYSIPLEVPPGRRGMQPQVTLEYLSNNPNIWLGTGWELNLGYIQRSLRNRGSGLNNQQNH